MSAPEFSRPLPVDRAGDAERTVSATPEECAALARRMAVPAIESLTCVFRLGALPGAAVSASGRLDARLTLGCVVTLEPFETAIAERFDVRFVPAGRESDDPDPDAPDEIVYDGAMIDLGEAAAEQLALALPAYPRRPGAVLPDEAAEPAPHPFAGLARFRQ